ncbi:MAG: beta-1,6-N-acetylglucosaminyltransferase [Lachnospiraceae bacterium]
MKKHAYLIMAHTQFELLKNLLECLDDERNDIYVHIDSKAENFNKSEFSDVLKKANLIFTDRTDVRWGTYSQIACELVLIKAAVQTEHAYYHLLSGMDLPIKSQDEIFAFFEENEGLEFVDEDGPVVSENILDRIRLYHHFIGKQGSLQDILGAVETKLQRLCGVNRLKKSGIKDSEIQKGRNWFSITHGLAKLIVEREPWIAETFRNSVCADELFVQTIVRNSVYAANICNPNTMPEIPDTRYIDWERGNNNNPYIFREGDYRELKNADALFARKFDLNIDRKIVEHLCRDLQQ